MGIHAVTEYLQPEEPLGNLIDEFQSTLTELFGIDQQKLRSLVKLLNDKGANVSGFEIEEVIKVDDVDGDRIRYCLAVLSHIRSYHPDEFKRDLLDSKLKRTVRSKVSQFLDSLNKNATDGMNVLYFAYIFIIKNPRIKEVEYDVMLNDIRDEYGERIGYLPTLHITAEIGGRKENFFSSLDDFRSLLDYLNEAYDEAVKTAKEYHKALGNSVVLPGVK